MTVWVLHCWAADLTDAEVVGSYPTLDLAVSWAAAYIEGESGVGIAGKYRSLYSVCQSEKSP